MTTQAGPSARTAVETVAAARAAATGAVVYTRDRPGGEETVALIRAAGLNGPTESPERMQRMLDEAQYVEAARSSDGRLVGFVRVLTDASYNAFVADLAVHPDHQGQGIGTRLMERALEADPQVKYILHAPADSAGFYRRFGFEPTAAMVRPRTRNT